MPNFYLCHVSLIKELGCPGNRGRGPTVNGENKRQLSRSRQSDRPGNPGKNGDRGLRQMTFLLMACRAHRKI
jgi:hypothetical protein